MSSLDIFLAGLMVGIALGWALDRFVLASLARLWAHHARASRVR